MRSMILPILIFPFLLAPALADFAMLPPEDAAAVSSGPASSPPTLPAAKHTESKPPEKARNTNSARKLPLALGFGNKIPLSFAVRQIVPSRIKVTFAKATDGDALVDWRGEREWPAVLREAVRPLGLHVTVHEHTVSIAR